MFAQLGVIPGTRNKFVEMVAAAVSYLSRTHVKNKESKKRPINKKGRKFSVPSLQYSQFGQDGRINRTFSGI